MQSGVDGVPLQKKKKSLPAVISEHLSPPYRKRAFFVAGILHFHSRITEEILPYTKRTGIKCKGICGLQDPPIPT
jgi:hypothetical protein